MIAYNLRLKQNCFNAYGGAICVGCKYNEIEELSLDHINNDGAAERRKIYATVNWKWAADGYRGGAGIKFYSLLKRMGYPNKANYQILCPTCQMRKRNGKCFLPAAFSVEKRIEIL